MSGPSHLPSDSDSEVYCDSVDQLGQEEVRAVSSTQPLELTVVDDSFIHRCQTSEHSRSLDGLDDEESQVLAPVKESGAEREVQEDHQAPPQVVRCGGEDGENGGAMPPRQRFNAEGSSSSAVRRGRGETLAGLRPAPPPADAVTSASVASFRLKVSRPGLWKHGAPAQHRGRRRRPLGRSGQGRREPERADRGGLGQAAGRHAERPGEASHPGGSDCQPGQPSAVSLLSGLRDRGSRDSQLTK